MPDQSTAETQEVHKPSAEHAKEKPKIPRSYTEKERVAAVRRALNIPEKTAEEKVKEKKEKLDAFYKEKQQELLVEGRGFIDENKSWNEEYASPPGTVPKPTLLDKMRKRTTLMTVDTGDLPIDAYEKILAENNMFSYNTLYSKRGITNLLKLGESCSPEQVDTGIKRIKLLLRRTHLDSRELWSSDFLQYIKTIGTIDEDKFSAMCSTLNNYTFLTHMGTGIRGGSGRDYEDQLKKGEFALGPNAKAILDMASFGEIPIAYQQRLDVAQRMNLLSGSIPIMHANGTIELASNTIILQDVLNSHITNPRFKNFVALAEEVSQRNLGREGSQLNSYGDGSLSEVKKAVETGKADIFLDLAKRGVLLDEKCLSDDFSMEDLQRAHDDPSMADWLDVLSVIDDKVYSLGDTARNNLVPKRHELTQMGVMIDFLNRAQSRRVFDPRELGILKPGYCDTNKLNVVIQEAIGVAREKLGTIYEMGKSGTLSPSVNVEDLTEQILQLPDDATIYDTSSYGNEFSSPFLQWMREGSSSLSGSYYVGSEGLQSLTPEIMVDRAGYTILSVMDYTTISEEAKSYFVEKAGSEGVFWEYFLETPHDVRTRELLLKNREALCQKKEITVEQMSSYLTLCDLIASSPSQEVQRLKDMLMSQVIEADDPIAAYEKVNGIFVKNNLPTVGKVIRVFEELYPPSRVEGILAGSKISPVLASSEYQRGEYRRQYDIIYRDLLKVHIGSGNRSMRDFAIFLDQGIPLFDKVLAGEALSPHESRRAEIALAKLTTLQQASVYGRETTHVVEMKSEDIAIQIQDLARGLGVTEGQTIQGRIEQMFLRPLKGTFPELQEIAHLSDIPIVMKEAKKRANERGLNLIHSAREGEDGMYVTLKSGDLIKHANPINIDLILENGIVSREYLGVAADSDQTPLGTDFTMVTDDDTLGGFAHAYSQSAQGYGDLGIVVKNRGQLQVTSREAKAPFEAGKYEVYQMDIAGERHMDVRTGLPSTEIDFFIARSGGPVEMDKLFFSIAKQGVYIPVVDETGKVLYSPDMYRSYRAAFDGVPEFSERSLRIASMSEEDRHYGLVAELSAQIREDALKVTARSEIIKEKINAVLQGRGVVLADEYDLDITHAQLVDTGSSARHTNVPGDYDFDLMLLLDANSIRDSSEIGGELIDSLRPTENNSHLEENGYYQVRAIGAQGVIDGETMDVDVGVASKGDLRQFATHDAIQAKLDWIKEHKGEGMYYDVLANIVLTKRMLKEAGVYKKQQGGFAGVGTEQWILAHGGNMLEAFDSFWEASHTASGEVVSFEDFKRDYKLLDAGVNLKFNKHDNFTTLLSEPGYRGMITMIENYRGQNNSEQLQQAA